LEEKEAADLDGDDYDIDDFTDYCYPECRSYVVSG